MDDSLVFRMYYINTRQLKEQNIKIRLRLIILLICLFVALIAIGITIHDTFSTISTVQQSQSLVHKGDVRIIDSWMTLPYVAHQQQVPAKLLYTRLHVKDDTLGRHLTLEELAEQRKEPTNTLIHQIQTIILQYRKTHPYKPNPNPMPAVTRGENALY